MYRPMSLLDVFFDELLFDEPFDDDEDDDDDDEEGAASVDDDAKRRGVENDTCAADGASDVTRTLRLAAVANNEVVAVVCLAMRVAATAGRASDVVEKVRSDAAICGRIKCARNAECAILKTVFVFGVSDCREKRVVSVPDVKQLAKLENGRWNGSLASTSFCKQDSPFYPSPQ
jgi:hypothetical protein